MQQHDVANWRPPPPQQQQPPWTGQQPWQVPPQQLQQQHSSELQAVLSQLGRDQQMAVDAVLKGQSVFLTGTPTGCCPVACCLARAIAALSRSQFTKLPYYLSL